MKKALDLRIEQKMETRALEDLLAPDAQASVSEQSLLVYPSQDIDGEDSPIQRKPYFIE